MGNSVRLSVMWRRGPTSWQWPLSLSGSQPIVAVACVHRASSAADWIAHRALVTTMRKNPPILRKWLRVQLKCSFFLVVDGWWFFFFPTVSSSGVLSDIGDQTVGRLGNGALHNFYSFSAGNCRRVSRGGGEGESFFPGRLFIATPATRGEGVVLMDLARRAIIIIESTMDSVWTHVAVSAKVDRESRSIIDPAYK